MDYSIVIPIFNEEESLRPLFNEIKAAMAICTGSYEIIFVNDGSSDQSASLLNGFLQEQSAIVKVIGLQRQGQTKALKEGIAQAQGNIVVTLDADLQNDPADIVRLIAKMKEGYDCVCGWRKSREDTFLKSILSKTGNVLQRLITGLAIHDVSCTLRAYKRQWAMKIPLNWEGQHRFIPLSLSLQGCKITEIVSHHRQRQFGISKYSHKRIFKVIIDFFRILQAKGRA